jgi:Alfin
MSYRVLGCLPVTGESDGSWAVDLPAEEVPAELPEPCLGINFARNGMQQRDWLALVAVHSDAWLLSVAFYYGGAGRMSCRVHAAVHATRAAEPCQETMI